MYHVCLDENAFFFPPVEDADEEGLLLIGGQVTAVRVLDAYCKGIFPWYNEEELPLWWSPDPRFVLFPQELHVSRSMQKVIAKGSFEFKTNTAFEAVIRQCGSVPREGQNGTWLTCEMKKVYTQLHYDGYAHSIEAWRNGDLVGGMYGVQLGNVFFGESMFSKVSNASKFAFIQFVQQADHYGFSMLDCQVYTKHLESLGARHISRKVYLKLLYSLL